LYGLMTATLAEPSATSGTCASMCLYRHSTNSASALRACVSVETPLLFVCVCVCVSLGGAGDIEHGPHPLHGHTGAPVDDAG
jgi:hypothetical protein